jgi:hypothetical protein
MIQCPGALCQMIIYLEADPTNQKLTLVWVGSALKENNHLA